MVGGGMICPKQAMIMGSFFMTREIELTAANVSDVYWDLRGRRIIWLLPASKTDASAKGVRRSWGCVCVRAVARHCAPFVHPSTLRAPTNNEDQAGARPCPARPMEDGLAKSAR